ncbi:MAG: threonylcarbamoyl-AMP synthase [Candidatus Omnitrophica bacterium]|nr:threonylcarbamoyl-AMP synthase [Candidatus Omnitrophota bacterium]
MNNDPVQFCGLSRIEEAARLIRAGEPVAFPTETVYGLGADATHPKAVAKIFAIKGRPAFDPLIVHAASEAQAVSLWTECPEPARLLMENFWPGPLTLVLPKAAGVPDLVTAGLPSVGVRIPNHPVALDLIRRSGVPIAAPSANRFGGISPTTAQAVAQELGEKVKLILDAGPTRVGVESTVVTFQAGTPVVLRPGGVPIEAIERIVGKVRMHNASDDPRLSPGMLTRHYAPATSLYVLRQASVNRWSSAIQIPSGKIGLLSYAPVKVPPGVSAIEILSSTGNLVESAAGFFQALRRLDAAGLDALVGFPVPLKGLGRALADRLERASAGQARLESGKLVLQSAS